jgi:hypothetical protein
MHLSGTSHRQTQLCYWQFWAGHTVYVRLCTSNTGLNSGQNWTESFWTKMLMVFDFEGKHTTCVRSNTTQVSVLILIALTYMLHVWLYLGHLHLLTYSMDQSPSWEAEHFSQQTKILRILCNLNFDYRIHKCPPSVSILSQVNKVRVPHPTSWPSI